ncbi:LysR family transcriptional regulator [Rugamonas sp. FT82W]|uniref:LysR family transcriptional regulator n=1 Tax=Duganella vulcania TaxID=2692166 RepID=A0A845FZL6_9BURK|nr:LysR family transcriptional regulator [Duganella vulcania]MYM87923.1 LysR family transcriptional regulator [Duganella vulcania]
MSLPDLNLLIALDALLSEGSVAGAARYLRLSSSAMSRSLARLREVTGDPLLVRAGRLLVPTPRAIELRSQVGQLLLDAQSVLRPVQTFDAARLCRTFTLRNSEGFVENFGPALIARVSGEAPGVRLSFLPKPHKESAPLRAGVVDLETGVIEKDSSPELRAVALFRDRYIGVVHAGHQLARGEITLARYAAGRHIAISREGIFHGPVDEALEQAGITRNVVTVVAGFATAVALARSSDMIAAVPERHTVVLRNGMYSFPLPMPVPDFTVALLWHPRMDADPAHRWLRNCVREVCSGG